MRIRQIWFCNLDLLIILKNYLDLAFDFKQIQNVTIPVPCNPRLNQISFLFRDDQPGIFLWQTNTSIMKIIFSFSKFISAETRGEKSQTEK